MDYYIEGMDILIEENDREKMKKDYAKRVKALRERMKMTQQQFGDYLNSCWMNDKIKKCNNSDYLII